MIRLGKIAQTQIRMHPAFPVLAAVYLFLGREEAFFSSFLALLFHETGHLLAAKYLKIPLRELEITPMGGVLKMDRVCGGKKEALLSMAGPAASLCAAIILGIFFRYRFLSLYRANLFLFLINLLPVFPMDGGRTLRGLLCARLNAAALSRTLLVLGCILGGGILFLGAVAAWMGQMNPMLFLSGSYVIHAAIREKETLIHTYIAEFYEKQKRIQKGKTLPVQWQAAHYETPCSVLACLMTSGRYTAFLLVDEKMRKKSVMEEGEILHRLLSEKE